VDTLTAAFAEEDDDMVEAIVAVRTHPTTSSDGEFRGEFQASFIWHIARELLIAAETMVTGFNRKGVIESGDVGKTIAAKRGPSTRSSAERLYSLKHACSPINSCVYGSSYLGRMALPKPSIVAAKSTTSIAQELFDLTTSGNTSSVLRRLKDCSVLVAPVLADSETGLPRSQT
jgi:hypothetical protein